MMQFINDDITPEEMTDNLMDSDSESLNDSSHAEQLLNDINANDIKFNIIGVMSPSTSTSSICTKALNCDQSEKRDDYQFFISLVPQMNQFNELQKLRIRYKITQVIIEAERVQFCYQSRYENNYEGYSASNCGTN